MTSRATLATLFALLLATAHCCNLELGKEYPKPGEENAIYRVKQLIEKQQNKEKNGSEDHADRFFHAKPHGCVRGTFTIRDDVPARFAKGLFSYIGQDFDVYMRFSNGMTERNPDSTADVRGCALKVFDVPGAKLTNDEPHVQDFITASYQTFFFQNVADLADGMEVLAEDGFVAGLKKGWWFLQHPLSAWGAFQTLQAGKEITNPLLGTYWSQTPYGLGEGLAVKYRVRPCHHQSMPPATSDPEYLRTYMEETLRGGEGCFVFEVQPQEDACDQPVEDSMVEWDTPYYPVATITIPEQRFDTPDQNTNCENAQFNPWHSLPEHRPLGINRARREVYNYSSDHRHSLNDVRVYYPEYNDEL